MVYANTFFAGANMAEDILKLVAAVLVGGLIGFERQFRHGTGLRTMMLVCLGATMFTLYSDLFAFQEGDPRRIAAAVVTGVGFLGAGMILRYRGGVMGLTTAATVWLVAALGMGIGIDQYVLVGVATILVLIVLWGVETVNRNIFLIGQSCRFVVHLFCEGQHQPGRKRIRGHGQNPAPMGRARQH
jgi:putative Mg2+ transporter-C (MgtC) family protein